MRRVVLAALCLALAGCGGEDVESGACASAISLHGEGYLGAHLDRPGPRAGPQIERGISPACNDSGPPYAEDREVWLREVSGMPPEVAVYVEGDDDTIYLSDRYRVFLPIPPGYRRRARGERCRIDGTVADVDAPSVRRGGREWTVSVDGRTRMEGFPSSLPYVKTGDRVQVDAVGCRGTDLVARRIALQP